MSFSFRPLPCLLVFALLGAISVSAVAGPQSGNKPSKDAQKQEQTDKGSSDARNQDSNDQRRNNQRRNQDALSDSIRRVEQTTRGQVLSAERVPYEGRNINRIKIVDDRGRVRVYMDDPQQPRSVGKPPTRGDDD